MAEELGKRKSRVFLVDDHRLVRENLTGLLGREADLEVCGEAEDGPAALSLIREQLPDLVILDISLKHSNGLDLLKKLQELESPPRVLILSMHEEMLYAERALRTGASGYITKEEAAVDVLPAIRTVLGGKIHLSERMASRLAEKSGAANVKKPDSMASFSSKLPPNS